MVPSGLPTIGVPIFPVAYIPHLIGSAAGLALVTFTSMMLTARSFASKNGYDLDADREFAALGAANVAAALSQSFAISGADSRTAVSDAAGGKTQVTGLVAAASLAIVLLFLTGPLRYVPIAALGAVLMLASVSLVDVATMKMLWRLDRVDLASSVLVTLGVVALGAIDAILLAVTAAVIRYVRFVSHPKAEVLGRVPGLPGFHNVDRHPDAVTTPGFLLFRFNGPIVFFNAPHFKRSLLAAFEAAGPGVRWVVIDMVPIPLVDATGFFVFEETDRFLRERGAMIVGAGRMSEWLEWHSKRGFTYHVEEDRLFPDLETSVEALAGRELPERSEDRDRTKSTRNGGS